MERTSSSFLEGTKQFQYLTIPTCWQMEDILFLSWNERLDDLVLASSTFLEGTKQFQYLSIPTHWQKWRTISWNGRFTKMTQAISVFIHSKCPTCWQMEIYIFQVFRTHWQRRDILLKWKIIPKMTRAISVFHIPTCWQMDISSILAS